MLLNQRESRGLFIVPAEVLFVSSNLWDAIGAKSVGFNTAWIERITPEAMAEACRTGDLVSPLTMFKALRMQMDELGLTPDYRVHGLSALVEKVLCAAGDRAAQAAQRADGER